MLNTINAVPNFTANKPRRTPESITIVGPTKGRPGIIDPRMDVKFDYTTVSFPTKTTLEDLMKSIDRMMNTYLGKSSPKANKEMPRLKMYG